MTSMTQVVPRSTASDDTFEPVFVVGHSRSGTTMLARIMDRHSQLAIPPEVSFFLPAYRKRLRAAERAGTHQALLDYLRDISRMGDITYRDYSEESIAERFRAVPATSSNLFRCLLEDYAATRRKPRCGEKTPMHILAVPRLLAAWPRARIICIIRDGRDVVESCLKWAHFTWEPAWYHTQSWCRLAALADAYQKRYPDQFLVFRYEALVEDPEPTIRRLDTFAGLPFEPGQVMQDGAASDQIADDWAQMPAAWKERATRAPDASRILAWRHSTNSREMAYLTALMNPWLAHYGYDTYDSPSVAGPRWRYPGYRLQAHLMRASQLSHRLTGHVVRGWRTLTRPFVGSSPGAKPG